MALYKRGKTWHTDFSVDGQRYRHSLDTSDWRQAQAREKELIARASEGKLTTTGQQFARMSFAEAAKQFLADRVARLAPNSIRTERERWTPLFRHMGNLTVNRISADTIRGYIRQRKDAGIENATINRELDVIRGVLKRAKRWHLMADENRPLPVRHKVGRALSYGDKVRLVRTAANRAEWDVAYRATLIALNTTMRGCELKGLHWRNVNLIDRTVTVCKSKTDAGERVIPLNGDAMDAFVHLHRRAQAFGGTEPNHYVFPGCESGHIDSTKPQRSWRTAWRQLTLAAGLKGLRFHDLRHHAITELAESQASDQTVMSIAGHVSPKMLSHYSHVRMEAKRAALDQLSSASRRLAAEEDATPEGYVTTHVTKAVPAPGNRSEMTENMVELVGIEPTTSSLRTMRSPS
jgi:integrase